MISVLLMALNCADTKIINHTKTWNNRDKAALERATSRCGEIYKDAPCLKTFIKKEDELYQAICTKEQK